MHRRAQLRGCLFVILSAVIFGCMPLGAKLLYAEGVTPMALVFLRNLLSLPILALLGHRQGGLKISAGALREVTFAGLVGCCITPVMLFTSYRYLVSGVAAVFHFCYPVVVVLGGLLLGERISRRTALCTVLCFCGILLLFDPGSAVSLPGAALAILSGGTYASYILLLGRFRHREVSGFRLSFYISLVCALATFLLCLATHQLTFPQSARGWALAFLFSFALSVGAVVLFQQGTFLIGAQRAAILSTLEPITSILAGVLVLHEALSARIVLGAAFTLLASVLIALRSEDTETAEAPKTE